MSENLEGKVVAIEVDGEMRLAEVVLQTESETHVRLIEDVKLGDPTPLYLTTNDRGEPMLKDVPKN